MLIKGVTKKGDAIPLSPQEALSHIVVRAVVAKNDKEFVYLPYQDSVAAEGQLVVSPKDDVTETTAGQKTVTKGYVAEGRGTVMVGKCRVKDGKTFSAKKWSFHIKYATAKDELGVPDISILESKCNPVQTVDIGAVEDNAK